jgi:HK97 family phage prohead protease
MTTLRAYSTLTIKAAAAGSDGKRRFTGLASSPSVDSMGDIVDPKGAQMTLPLPLLWQHDSHQPIGWVTAAKVSDAGIVVEGEVASVETAGTLRDRLDSCWQMMQAKLVRGLSIGFSSIEAVRIETGRRCVRWALRELSVVTLPANVDCTILAVKSADRAQLRAAATGPRKGHVAYLNRTSPRRGVVYL